MGSGVHVGVMAAVWVQANERTKAVSTATHTVAMLLLVDVASMIMGFLRLRPGGLAGPYGIMVFGWLLRANQCCPLLVAATLGSR